LTSSGTALAKRVAWKRPQALGGTKSATGGRLAISIRWRLTLWFTAIVFVVLSAFSLIAYWYLGTSLTRSAHQEAVLRSLQVQDLMRREETVGAVYVNGRLVRVMSRYETGLAQSLDPFRNPGVLVRAFDPRGWYLGGSTAFAADSERLPLNRAGLVTALKGAEHAEVLNTSFGPFYAYTRPSLSADGRLIGAIQILTSRAPYDATMDRLARVFGVATLLATFLSLAMGAAMAQTALAPIDSITRTAQGIVRRQDLSRRIPIDGPPDEVGRLSATINEMLDRVEALFERQRQFLADASHELRTPLTTLRGEIELMDRAQRIDPEGLEAMAQETERMARMVNDLLLLARADTGLEMRLATVAVEEVMAEVARQSRTLSPAHPITLATLEPVSVTGDRDRIKQLVLILVDNAVTHTPAGTEISLGLAQAAGGGATITVSDNGPGIPLADQPRVFDRFYRVDKARSRSSGGTGLGLSIAQWIATAHAGSIRLDSTPGLGTRFTISLPAHGGNS
jgi:signal transduction histidine kinase